MESSSSEEIIPRDQYGYRLKRCGICSRIFGKMWQYHWRTQHKTREPLELAEGTQAEMTYFDIKDKRFKTGIRAGSGNEYARNNMLMNTPAYKHPGQITDKYPALFFHMHWQPEPGLDSESSGEIQTAKDDRRDKGELKPSKPKREAPLVYSHEKVHNEAVEFLAMIEDSPKDDAHLQFLLVEMSYTMVDRAVLSYLLHNRHPRLQRLLLDCSPEDDCSPIEMAGLDAGLYSQGGFCFQHASTYLSQVCETKLDEVIDIYEQALMTTHQNRDVVRWLVLNYEHYEDNLTPLILHLLHNLKRDAFAKIQIARFVHLPDDLNDYCTVAQTVSSKKLCELFTRSLRLFQDQHKICFLEFRKLARQLTLVEGATDDGSPAEWLLEFPIFFWTYKLEELHDNQQAKQQTSHSSHDYKNLSQDDEHQNANPIDQTPTQILESIALNAQIMHQNGPMPLGENCVTHLMWALSKYPRQAWSLHNDLNMSDVLFYTGLIGLLKLQFKHVHYIFPNIQMLKQQQESAADHWIAASVDERVFYHTGMHFDRCEDDLILIAEVDYFALQHAGNFPVLLGSVKTIGFQFRMDIQKDEDVERDLLEMLLFASFDLDFTNQTQSGHLDFDLGLRADGPRALHSYIDNQLELQPVLLYDNGMVLHADQVRGWHNICVDAHTDRKGLERLDVRDEHRKYPIVFTQDEQALRGLHLRAPSTGIMLIVTQQFETERQYQHALRMVGIWADKCVRVKAFEGKVVDSDNLKDRLQTLQRLSKLLGLDVHPSKTKTRLRDAKAAQKLQGKQIMALEPSSKQPKRQ